MAALPYPVRQGWLLADGGSPRTTTLFLYLDDGPERYGACAQKAWNSTRSAHLGYRMRCPRIVGRRQCQPLHGHPSGTLSAFPKGFHPCLAFRRPPVKVPHPLRESGMVLHRGPPSPTWLLLQRVQMQFVCHGRSGLSGCDTPCRPTPPPGRQGVSCGRRGAAASGPALGPVGFSTLNRLVMAVSGHRSPLRQAGPA